MDKNAPAYIKRDQLQLLLDLLENSGYEVIGPQVRDGAIVFDHLSKIEQLPRGWRDQQQPGSYRLSQTSSPRLFDWANGPQAIKPLMYPAREILWQAERRDDGSLSFIVPDQQVPKVAVIGAKACDVAALALQDKHFLSGEYVDPGYQARRKGLFLVAVNCSSAADTCFCASTGDGPEVTDNYDLALTELDQGFVIQAGSQSGRNILKALPLKGVSQKQLDQALKQRDQVVAQQQRRLKKIAKDDLEQQRQHPQWQDIAERCLACGNCTMVCPTCFCHQQRDQADLLGKSSSHVREWDSCFGESHGQLAGFQVRNNIKQRYQQWMIHKLDHWQEQYGRSGCTGCGRCMSWCPAEIDFVAEANLIAGGQDD